MFRLLSCIAVYALYAYAQVGTAELSGTVSDPSDAAFANAMVTAVNAATSL
jgi:hypothetical protein